MVFWYVKCRRFGGTHSLRLQDRRVTFEEESSSEVLALLCQIRRHYIIEEVTSVMITSIMTMTRTVITFMCHRRFLFRAGAGIAQSV
jgi:hypothetical protein